MGFFSLLVLLVFNFSFELGGAALHEIGPGVLWSAFVFACLLGLNRSFADERENHSLDALLMAPGDRGAIYLGKMIANLVFLLAVELICLPFFALFFNLSPGFFLLPLLGVLVLGSACLSAAGTLFAALSSTMRLRELLLPLLLLRRRLSLRQRDRELKPNMMLPSRPNKKLSDLLLSLLRKPTKLLKLLERLVKKSKSLPIRDRWLLVDLLSRRHSETSGPLEIPVCHSFT